MSVTDPARAATLDDINRAIRAGDLAGAIELLDRGIAESGGPEMHLLRGQLAYYSLAYDEACKHLETAVRQFHDRGLVRRAALASAWVGRVYYEGRKNRAAARGWLARAERLLQSEGRCIERGWAAVNRIGCVVASADELEASARLALEISREFGDADLEAKALADGGLALVSSGRVDEGMAWIDESMAMVSAGMVAVPIGGQASCSMLSACERSGDLARAESWLDVLDERSGVLFTHCRIACGALLCEVGRSDEGGAMLEEVIGHGDRLVYFHRATAHAALAELRIREQRLDEAERLLVGFDDQVEALLPLARLHLARGSFDLAAAVARRALRALDGDVVRTAPLLVVMTEAHLGRGDAGAARASAERLAAVSAACDVPSVRACTAMAEAKVLAAEAKAQAAVSMLEDALADLGETGSPLLRCGLHLELARLHHAAGDHAAAVSHAGAMMATLRRLGPAPWPAAVAAVRDLGLIPADPEAELSQPVDARLDWDGRCWDVAYGPTSARLRDTKGLRYLAELVSRPGVETHVLDLVAIAEGAEGSLPDSDAGPVLDARAKAAYRRRLEELREQMDDAEACLDEHRAAEVQAEIDAVVAELARAIGLGGRDRRAASAAERARLNVTRALRSAIRSLGDVQPQLAAHLDASVRTGFFCSYDPSLVATSSPRVRWLPSASPRPAG